MLIKIFLAIAMSLSVSCFAESGSNNSKSSTDSNQQTPASQLNLSTTKENTKENSQATQDPEKDKKPSMADYCKKHTC